MSSGPDVQVKDIILSFLSWSHRIAQLYNLSLLLFYIPCIWHTILEDHSLPLTRVDCLSFPTMENCTAFFSWALLLWAGSRPLQFPTSHFNTMFHFSRFLARLHCPTPSEMFWKRTFLYKDYTHCFMLHTILYYTTWYIF